MINLFSIATNDQSVYYLGQIFGYVGTLLPAKDAPLLLGMMFRFLNSIALTIGAFMVVYVTVVGLIATAHEGEFMGKKWSGLWVPLRTVFGIAALFPTATGYSAIQVVFMWVILQGVGAADTLWGKIIDYTAQTGSPTSRFSASTIDPNNVQINIRKLFQSLVCQAEARVAEPNVNMSTGGTMKFYCAPVSGMPSADAFCPTKRSNSDMLNILTGPQSNNKNAYGMGPNSEGASANSSCGVLTYCDATTNDLNNTNSQCLKFETKDGAKIVPGKLDTDSVNCLVCKAQQASLQTIVSTLGAIADQFASIDYTYVYFYEQGMKARPEWLESYCSAQNIDPESCCVIEPKIGGKKICVSSPAFPDDVAPADKGGISNASAKLVTDIYGKYAFQSVLQGSDFINGALGTYIANIAGAISDWIQKQKPTLQPWQAEAKNNGWILAGAYYFKMANAEQTVISATQPPINVTASKLDKSYRINYDAAQTLMDQLASNTNQSTSMSFGGGGDEFSGVSKALDNTSGTLLRTMISNMSGHGGSDVNVTKPLASLASYGYALMISAQILFFVLTGLAVVIAGIASINPIFVGTGITMNPIGEGIKAGISLISPFFVILVVSLYSLGATLGIYIPLIPVIVFTVGAIGWFIATIEAMVAAPLVALGILSPGGQHEILGRAEPALMLLFNLFLRPTLMILGLMAAMLVSIAVVSLVNVAFLNAVSTIMTAPGLFEEIMFLAVYTTLLVTALNKTFSLIYVVPERVLTWIGGPAVQYGEGEALGAAKHGVEGASGATTGAGKEAGAGAAHGAGSYYSAKQQEDNKGELDRRAGAGSVSMGSGAGAGGASGGGAAGGGAAGSGASSSPSSGGGEEKK